MADQELAPPHIGPTIGDDPAAIAVKAALAELNLRPMSTEEEALVKSPDDDESGTPEQRQARAHLLKVLDSDAEFDRGTWQRVDAWIAVPQNARELATMGPDAILRTIENLIEAFSGFPPKELKGLDDARTMQAQTDARDYMRSLDLSPDVLEKVGRWITNLDNARSLADLAPGLIPDRIDMEVERFEIALGVEQLAADRKRLQEHNDAISRAFKEAYLEHVVVPLDNIKSGRDSAGREVPTLPGVKESEVRYLAIHMLDQVREDDFKKSAERRYRTSLAEAQDEIGHDVQLFAGARDAASFDAWVLTGAPLDLLHNDLGKIFKDAFGDLDLDTSGIKDIRTFIETELIEAQRIADRGLVATGRLQAALASIEKILLAPAGESEDRQDLYAKLLEKFDDVDAGLVRDYADLAKKGQIEPVQGYLDDKLLPELSVTLDGSFGEGSIVRGDLAATLSQLVKVLSPDETTAREEEVSKLGFNIVASKIKDDLPLDAAIAFENVRLDMERRYIARGGEDPEGFFETDPEGKEYSEAADAARAATGVVANRRETWIRERTAIREALSSEGRQAFDAAEPDLYAEYEGDTALTARDVLSDFVKLAEETKVAAAGAAEIAALRPAQFNAAFELIKAGLPEGGPRRLEFEFDRRALRAEFLESGSLNATEFLEGHETAGAFAADAKEEAAGKAVEDELGRRFDLDANTFETTLTAIDETAFAKVRARLKDEFVKLGGEGGFDAFIGKRLPGFIARADAQAAGIKERQALGKPAEEEIATEISRLQSRIDSGDFSPEETALAQQRLNLLTRFGDAAASQFGAAAAAGDTQTREEFLAGAFPSPEIAPDPVGGAEAAAARVEAGVAPLDFSRRDIFTPGDITTVDRNIEAQFLGAEADTARQFAGIERDPVTGRPNFGSVKGLEGYFPSLEDFSSQVQARAKADARRLNQPTDNIGSDIMNQAIAQELAFIRGEGTIDRPGDVGATEAAVAAGRARSVTPPSLPPARVVR
jgi:hypothetical protein